MLYFKEYSSEKEECILFLHGFLGAGALWDEMRVGLSDSYHCIIPDLPGHGKSDCFAEVHSMDAIASEVINLLDEKCISKCHIMGHSMGGYVALALLDAYPERCKSVCLLNSTSTEDSQERKKVRNKSISLVRRSPAVYIRAIFSELFPEDFKRPNRREHALNIGMKTPIEGITASLRGMMERKDRTALLHSFEPVLFIYSESDPILDWKELQELVHILPKQKVLKIEGGHMGLLEHPRVLYSEYLSWLKAL